uniref:Amine oxidase domain-containing protein n=1 Tax=Parascaris equorum TaxID=6256 RepID=A0A914RR07_PAREQ
MVGIMWLIITAIALFLLAIILRYLWRMRRGTIKENCFRKMVCTGIPKEAPISENEKHNILRQDFHPSKVASTWDVIVIGSGLSGLTIAKILAASSRKVLVLEQHDRAGGACHTFDLDRFEFDVGERFIVQKLLPHFMVDGLHYVAEMYPGSVLYKICSAMSDSQVQWQRIEDPFDVVSTFSFLFVLNVRESCLKEIPWMFRIKFLPTPITRFFLKWGIFHLFTKICKYSERTLLDTMQEFAFSKELQAVCSYYYVNYGIPPNRASFFQHWLFLLDGGYYPVGGTTMITSNIVRSIEKFGGKVLVKADVKEIIFEDGKVKGLVVNYGSAGCFIETPMIVSTIPLIHLFSDLIPQQVSTNLTMFDVVKQLNAVDSPKVATFQAYIGLGGSQKDLKLPGNNCFYFRNNDILEIDKYLRLDKFQFIIYSRPMISKNNSRRILQVS